MFNENVSQKTLAVLPTNILYSYVSQSVSYKNSWNSDSKGTEDMQEYAKHFARWMLSTFWRVFARKYIFLDLEAGQGSKAFSLLISLNGRGDPVGEAMVNRLNPEMITLYQIIFIWILDRNAKKPQVMTAANKLTANMNLSYSP